MTLPFNEVLSCFFSLTVILVFTEIGLRIVFKYFKYKNRAFIYMGFAWVGLGQFWWGSFINPFLILTNISKDGISAEWYYLLNFSFLIVTLFLTTTAVTVYALEKYQRYFQIFAMVLALPFQIISFYFIFTNPSFLIQKPEPNRIIYSTFTIVYIFVLVLFFIILGFAFSIHSLKSLSKDTRFKGKLLLVAYSLFFIGGIMDTLEKGILLDFIDRIILIFAAIFFYHGFIMPRDVTERIVADKLLKESEERFRSTFEQAAVGMAHVSLEGSFLRVNKKFCDIIGYSMEELLLKSIQDLILPEERSQEQILFLKLNQDKSSTYKTEKRYIKRDGAIIWVKVTTSLLRDSKGTPTYFIFVVEDISDKKKAEERLQISEKNYKDAYNSAELYKDLFAHDIANILQTIRSANDLLNIYNEKLEKSDMENLIDLINTQVTRAALLVSNIRNLSKLEQTKIDIKQVDAIGVLKDAIDFLKSSFRLKNLKIEVESEVDSLFTNANDLLLDAFENILINAVRHNKNESVEIIIKVSHENNLIKFQFLDNGIGIEDSRKEIVFKRENGENFKNDRGLGLSIVKKIIESYNGKIWVENRVFGDYSKGSTFIITLPKV